MSHQPNILFIHTDEQRVDSLGCYSNDIVSTPHIDGLADDGVTFDEGHCTHPLCSPSRGTLMTGRYPNSHGTWRNGIPLSTEETTIADRLSNAGYQTGLLGKAHFTPYRGNPEIHPESVQTIAVDEEECWDYWRNFNGPYYGFEHVEMTIAHGHRSVHGGHYGLWLEENHPEAKPLFQQEAALDDTYLAVNSWKSAAPLEAHSSTWVADRTIEFIEQNAGDQPFFGWVGFPDPHFPYDPPEPYCHRYDPEEVPLPVDPAGEVWEDEDVPQYITFHLEEKYGIDFRELTEAKQREIIAHTYAMVDLVDDSVGRILEALEAQGIADDTIIVFTSDHADWLGDHGLFQKGIPHARDLTRIPWIVKWPGVNEPGRRVQAPTSQVDLVPTLLDAAGVDIPYGVQGESLRPVLTGEQEALRPFAYVEHRHEAFHEEGMFAQNAREGVGGGLMQDIISWGDEDIHVKTVYADGHRFSYVTGVPESYSELFDLAADPEEMTNLWGEDSDLERRMFEHLTEALIHAQDPLPEREHPV